MGKWISVDDKIKPKNEQYVIVYAPRRAFSRCNIDVCQYTEKYGFDVSCVEKWMPLPEPPEVE